MRTVSFVGHVDLDVQGGVSPSALTIADVDNDGQNELVVGTETGELFIFKGLQTEPLCHVTELGMVTAVCCGRLTGADSIVVAVISGNGWVHLLDWDGAGLRQQHAQRIPANVKTALLHDVDQDGQMELVVALTDRVVRVYRWADGSLRAISKCELMQQIGNISLNVESDGRRSVLVSQPGAVVVRLRYRSSTDEDGRECHSVDIDDVSQVVKTRQSVSCEVLGGPASNTYALCTLDGSLFFVKDNTVQWWTALHHQLFGLTKLDVTSDGSDELIVSSWDGHTFIVNQEAQSVQFLFEEPVTAFAAGQYGVSGANVPCMVYATVGKVVLYHNVRLPVMVTETLTDTVARRHGWPGAERLTPRQLQHLYSWCLYGFPSRPADVIVQGRPSARGRGGRDMVQQRADCDGCDTTHQRPDSDRRDGCDTTQQRAGSYERGAAQQICDGQDAVQQRAGSDERGAAQQMWDECDGQDAVQQRAGSDERGAAQQMCDECDGQDAVQQRAGSDERGAAQQMCDECDGQDAVQQRAGSDERDTAQQACDECDGQDAVQQRAGSDERDTAQQACDECDSEQRVCDARSDAPLLGRRDARSEDDAQRSRVLRREAAREDVRSGLPRRASAD